jgi:acyl-CoA thioester hydrolase
VPAYSPPRRLASGCNCAEHARVTVLPAYRATILPEWIDYNGHLRDAYYMVALSYAIDEVMDHLGLDAAYRERTKCTLYTLELHMHFLQEVKSTDELTVTTSILDFDRKRIHAGCEFSCPRMSEAAATAEVMLLHVHQGDKPASASFPPEVLRKLETLKLSPDVLAARGLGSRKIELKRR